MKIHELLAKAQSEFPPIPKTKEGQVGTRKYAYADLGDVLKAIVPVLNKHGLALVQSGSFQNDVQVLVTELRDKEDGVISSIFALPPAPDAQKFGAILTYYRRYAICSLLGVVGDDDTDAVDTGKGKGREEAAKSNGDKMPASSTQPKPLAKPPTMGATAPNENLEWIVDFGKFQGKNLYAIPLKDVKSYANHLINAANESKKPLNGKAKVFVDKVREMAGLPPQ